MIGAKSHILSRAFRKKLPFTERLLYHLNETNSGESPAEMNLALLENRLVPHQITLTGFLHLFLN